jgi:hypothetical protein
LLTIIPSVHKDGNQNSLPHRTSTVALAVQSRFLAAGRQADAVARHSRDDNFPFSNRAPPRGCAADFVRIDAS